MAIYEQWKQTYPRDSVPWDNLALGYEATDSRKSLWPMPAKRMRLNPKDRFAYANVADAYENLGRFDEARTVIEQATAQGLGSPSDAFSLYTMAFSRGDEAGMRHAMDLGKGPSIEPVMFLLEGMGQCSLGKIQSARQTFAQGVSSAQASGLKEFAAGIRTLESSCLAEVGNPALARQVALQALASSDDRDTRVAAADALARAGDTSRSQKLIAELAGNFLLTPCKTRSGCR